MGRASKRKERSKPERSKPQQPRRKERLFHHPQRGTVLQEEDLSPDHYRWRGGRDSDWREVMQVEMVAAGGLWRPVPGQRLPAGFLWGEPERQRYGLGGPVLVFGPIEKICHDCGDEFVHAAAEQKHLIEDLQLDTSVTTNRCRACRRAKVALEKARKAYAEALQAAERTPTAAVHLEVARTAVEVVSAGGRAPLDRALGHCRRARKLGASEAAADRIERQIATLRAAPVTRR